MTITLESISELLERGFIDAYDDPGQVKASIDAAIRERDRLRGDVSGMTEELLHVPSREEWRELQKRAKRAEAELAALKALLRECEPIISAYAESLHLTDGFRRRPHECDGLAEQVRALVKVEE